MSIKREDLEFLIKQLNEEAGDLIKGEEWTDRPAEWGENYCRYPEFVLQHGSQTNGIAFRLFVTGGTEYRTGWGEPRFCSSYLGATKEEVHRALSFLLAGIRMAKAGK